MHDQPAELPARASSWRAFPAAAAQVAMIGGACVGLIFGMLVVILIGWPLRVAWPVLSWGQMLLTMALAVLALFALGMWLGYRRWKFSQWKLDDTGLHVRRGQFWRREILVPRSRVQHLDIERGPIERHFGLATLIVHTAGTRLHAVRQPGFPDADAISLRDALVPASDRHDDVL